MQLMLNAVDAELGPPRVTNQHAGSVGPAAVLEPLVETVCEVCIIEHVSKYNQVPLTSFQIQNVLG